MRYYPMAYTLVSAVLIFGVILVVAQTASVTVAAALYFALELWLMYLLGTYTWDYVHGRIVGWTGVVVYFDMLIALIMGFAGVWQGIYFLDNTQFIGVIATTSQYRSYVQFLLASAGWLSTAGFATMIPRGLFSELWGVIGTLLSIWFLVMLFGGDIKTRVEAAYAKK